MFETQILFIIIFCKSFIRDCSLADGARITQNAKRIRRQSHFEDVFAAICEPLRFHILHSVFQRKICGISWEILTNF